MVQSFLPARGASRLTLKEWAERLQRSQSTDSEFVPGIPQVTGDQTVQLPKDQVPLPGLTLNEHAERLPSSRPEKPNKA